jgi:CRISPR-associated protein (TIGR03984 family)
MTREIKAVSYQLKGPTAVDDPIGALHEHATRGSFKYLLAHAVDGVIWGVVRDGQLLLSSDAFPEVSPQLRATTLQQARLFGAQGEVMLWRTEKWRQAHEMLEGTGEDRQPGVAARDQTVWQSREVIERTDESQQAYDEAVLLWGTDEATAETRGAFTALEETDLGIKHTPPLKPKSRRALKLIMRHYLDFDREGAAFVKLSRLVDLTNGGEG